LLQISGQSSVDHATGTPVGGYDIVAQTEQAYKNISRIMDEGGYSMDDIVNTIEWVAPNGMMDYRKVGGGAAQKFRRPLPFRHGDSHAPDFGPSRTVDRGHRCGGRVINESGCSVTLFRHNMWA